MTTSTVSTSDPSAMAQAALERAKAIAAKLSGTVETAAAAGKRRRWDDPDGAAGDDARSQQSNITHNNSNKQPKTAADAEAIHDKRVWITPTEERPAQHFVLLLAEQLETLSSSSSSSGSTGGSSASASARLLGKGTDEAVVPGMPQQPLHVLVQAPSHQQLTAAVSKVQQWIDDAMQAPVMNFDETALTVMKTAESNTRPLQPVASYRPASVAQLIHGSSHPMDDVDAAHVVNEIIYVPHSIIGFIIGRGGETIARLQATTGVKMHIQKETELQPGQTMREITLMAPDQAALQNARQQVEALVQEKCGPSSTGSSMRGNNPSAPGLGFSNKDAKVQEAIAAGHAHVTILVPEDDVGLVIGKAGATIRHIQETTGCSIQVPQKNNKDEPNRDEETVDGDKPGSTRTVHVTHPNEQGALAAKAMIEDILKNKPTHHHNNNNNNNNSNYQNQVTIQVAVPDKDVGLIIGRQGCVIRQIQSSSNCRVQIPPQCGYNETHRIISVSGSQEGTEMVRKMLETISAEQSSGSVMAGNFTQRQPQQGYYGQQQQHHQPSQQDPNMQYSADWAAYHAAQAAMQQQQQQQQVQQQAQRQAATHAAVVGGGATTATAAAASTSDDYREQFFRYAYYYGDEAARQYYGAEWSPPVGTPNPYGVNPNLATTTTITTAGAHAANATTEAHHSVTTAPPISAASVAAPSTTETSGTSSATLASVTQVRDSSCRKVSNLPAWMTK